ncbi:DUF4166 domain-containing protein [Lolliginicoccus suaedae]|uniref:DUF4166 domain-containing protein n=1 Tax=Lolliginicoccus suaedae TaxID=2605429 RepID=UPI0011EC4DB8|nr:DUF4166 domain-containing protein [Lolliginicoccus suaedae]
MPSVIQQALGSRFERLHPKVQWRFALASSGHRRQIGTGVMEEMSHSLAIPAPMAWMLGARRVAPAHTGYDIPFTVENYAYLDDAGRETYSYVRTFDFGRRTSKMDSVMVPSSIGASVIDYLGAAPDMAVRTQVWVDADGGLRLTSGPPRFLVPLQPRLPALASATTEAREWWDAKKKRHGIQVEVRNPVLGRMFFYLGHFTVTEEDCPPGRIPARARTKKLVTAE